MSKCVKCGNEILTEDIHWEMGLCNNCYNELYKDHKTHISLDKMWLKLAQDFRDENEKLQDKVADLETKLAESEKSKESYRLQNEQHHLQLLQFYSRLGVEAFGADIHEKALETLMIMKEELEEKNGVERALSACNRQNDEFAEMIKKLVSEKEELKQQLAEKEKSLSIKSVVRTLVKDNNLNCTFRDKTNAQIQQCGDVYNSNYGYFNFEDDYDESLNNKTDNRFDITSIDLTDQDKISFALEQLGKVKELLNTDFESTISWIDPYEDGEYLNSMTYNHNNTIKIIDNQIKQLKEMKEYD